MSLGEAKNSYASLYLLIVGTIFVACALNDKIEEKHTCLSWSR
jgi:hypothetical protein